MEVQLQTAIYIISLAILCILLVQGYLNSRLEKIEAMLEDIKLDVGLYEEFQQYKRDMISPRKKSIKKVGNWKK